MVSESERFKIRHDVQTQIFEVKMDINAHEARTSDRAYKAYDEYIRP